MKNDPNKADRIYRTIAVIFAAVIPVMSAAVFLMLAQKSIPSIIAFGPGFLVRSVWDPVAEIYGALPFIYGTLLSSFIALVIAVPLGLGCAVYLSEVSKSKFKEYIATMVDMLAAIPSVVYGLWGIFVLGPFLVQYIQPFLAKYFGFIPLFQGPPMGLSMMTGGVILAIMILPTITSVSREILQVVPNSLRESAMALGATKWETVRTAVLPPAVSGIVGAVILALGRAVGETMAITMVIGNRPEVSASLFAPGYTLASVIANEFAEASSPMNLSAMFEIGLILLLLTVVINGLARILIWKIAGKGLIQ
ncbi:MAG: phosphate ABC transporter permease subunit PstC [Candidatus Saganbacteria bacterium]|nr:phosphate ABC transporter permease subunit PstC [Candidatus Saganbacteria bacterium]